MNSLRYSLMVVVILLPSLAILAFSIMAQKIFEVDKKSFVFDSSVSVAQSLATQVRLEFETHEKLIEPVIRSIQVSDLKFSPLAAEYFHRQKRVEHLILYSRDEQNIFKSRDHMYLKERVVKTYSPGGEVVDHLVGRADKYGFAFQELGGVKRYFLLAKKYLINEKTFISLSVYFAPELYETFANPTTYRSYIVSFDNFMGIEPKYTQNVNNQFAVESAEFFKPIFVEQLPEGTAELRTANGRTVLVSYARVNYGGLTVATLTDKSLVLSVVETLKGKTMLFLLAFVSASLVFAVILHFLVQTSLVQQLAKERKIHLDQKEKEISIWSKVLLPSSQGEYDEVEVVASNLDKSRLRSWFKFSDQGHSLYLWFGEVTSKELPEGLVVSIVKSTVTLLEQMPELEAEQALRTLNYAIHEASEGKGAMNFFMATLDKISGTLSYAISGSLVAQVVPLRGGFSEKSLVDLSRTKRNPELGVKIESEFPPQEYLMSPGDILFLSSNDLFQFSYQDKKIDSLQLKKLIVNLFENSEQTLMDRLHNLQKQLKSYASHSQQETYKKLQMICQFKKIEVASHESETVESQVEPELQQEAPVMTTENLEQKIETSES